MRKAWEANLPLEAIRRVSGRHGLDPELISAICQTETRGNPWAIRVEVNKFTDHTGRVIYRSIWKWYENPESIKRHADRVGSTAATEWICQATAWGIMQVQGTVARELGFRGWLPELCSLKTGLEIGCRKVDQIIKRWGADPATIYAAYNGGSPKKDPKTLMFKNQRAVDRFMRYYRELKRID